MQSERSRLWYTSRLLDIRAILFTLTLWVVYGIDKSNSCLISIWNDFVLPDYSQRVKYKTSSLDILVVSYHNGVQTPMGPWSIGLNTKKKHSEHIFFPLYSKCRNNNFNISILPLRLKWVKLSPFSVGQPFACRVEHSLFLTGYAVLAKLLENLILSWSKNYAYKCTAKIKLSMEYLNQITVR